MRFRKDPLEQAAEVVLNRLYRSSQEPTVGQIREHVSMMIDRMQNARLQQDSYLSRTDIVAMQEAYENILYFIDEGWQEESDES